MAGGSNCPALLLPPVLPGPVSVLMPYTSVTRQISGLQRKSVSLCNDPLGKKTNFPNTVLGAKEGFPSLQSGWKATCSTTQMSQSAQAPGLDNEEVAGDRAAPRHWLHRAYLAEQCLPEWDRNQTNRLSQLMSPHSHLVCLLRSLLSLLLSSHVKTVK